MREAKAGDHLLNCGSLAIEYCHSNMNELTAEEREALPLDIKQIMKVIKTDTHCSQVIDFLLPRQNWCRI